MISNKGNPLHLLVGKWEGSKGVDIAPDADDVSERNDFHETIEFTAVQPLDNAEIQDLDGVKYTQVVRRLRDDKIIHEQVGFWMVDIDNQSVVHSFTIPRGVSILAGGVMVEQAEKLKLKAAAHAGDAEYGILQTAFLGSNAKTLSYEIELDVQENTLRYSQLTKLFIYGNDFDHHDSSELTRVS